ncbi:MAG: hypothetical protein M5R36_03165, partial [Deltaproteobacteria bacterium]|nr:hypothetical protein [Deltaproteobacteria bacterium]
MHVVSAVAFDHQHAQVFHIDFGRIAEGDVAAAFVQAVRARDDFEQRPDIFGAPRNRTGRQIAKGRAGGHRVLAGSGDHAARRFVAEDAVEKRGHTNGAADVGAESEGRGAGPDNRSFAAGTAAHDAPGVVRVIRLPVDAVTRLHPHAQFGRVGHADRDGARLAKPGDGGRVAFADNALAFHDARR